MLCNSTNQCFGANSDDANRLTTAAPAGSIPSITAGVHDDFKIASDSIFDSYDFDGVRGPCLDTDSDGDCDANDSPLTSWRYENKSDVDAATSVSRWDYLLIPIMFLIILHL